MAAFVDIIGVLDYVILPPNFTSHGSDRGDAAVSTHMQRLQSWTPVWRQRYSNSATFPIMSV